MEKQNLAYCNNCEELVEFEICDDTITEQYRNETVEFKFIAGHCKCCGSEVATDVDYNTRRSAAKIKAYKKAKDIITLEEITEILDKYDVGKEALAEIAGFGKVTVKRYYEGVIPSKKHSDLLMRILNDEAFFISLVRNHESRLKKAAYDKIIKRYERLMEIQNSKIDQVVNYMIIQLKELTPVTLDKLLYFTNGVNYAVNGVVLISENTCKTQQYLQKYRYKPIDNGIQSTHGCMLSRLSDDEIKVLNLVIGTFGLFSSRTLERIAQSQILQMTKQVQIRGELESGKIDKKLMKEFYINNHLDSKEHIFTYILETIQKTE